MMQITVVALEAVREFQGVIDVLYIGDDANQRAIDFMRRLANGGTVSVNDIKTQTGGQRLLPELRRLLPRS